MSLSVFRIALTTLVLLSLQHLSYQLMNIRKTINSNRIWKQLPVKPNHRSIRTADAKLMRRLRLNSVNGDGDNLKEQTDPFTTTTDSVQIFAVENDHKPDPGNEQNSNSTEPKDSSNVDTFAASVSTKPKAGNVGLFAADDRVKPVAKEEKPKPKIANNKPLMDATDKFIIELLSGLPPLYVLQSHRKIVRKELFFRLLELEANAQTDQEKKLYAQLYETMLGALRDFDKLLFTEITVEMKRTLDITDDEAARDKDELKQLVLQRMQDQNLIRNTSASVFADLNMTMPLPPMMMPPPFWDATGAAPTGNASFDMGRNIVRFPSALPINLLPMLLRSGEINIADQEILKTAVFTEDLLNNTLVDNSLFISAFRGVLTRSVEATVAAANERIGNVPGLGDRVRLFALPEYRVVNNANLQVDKYSGAKFEPVFIVLSRNVKPLAPKALDYGFAVLTLLLTVFSTFIFATDLNSLNADFLQRALSGDDSVVGRITPIVFGALGLQALHDLGHYLSAIVYNAKLSFPPVYVPSLQIGFFGSVTRFLDFPKNRKELFNISIAGPLIGFIASLACTLYGMQLTALAPPDVAAQFPVLPAGFFKSYFLLYQLLEQPLHLSTMANTALTPIHPALAVGVIGMITNALNFMPIGRLDGGRVVSAIGGPQGAASITFAVLLGEAVSFLTNPNPITLFWIITVVLFQRGGDIPPQDNVTPVATEADDQRKGIAWYGRLAALVFCVVLTSGMLLPVPEELGNVLNGANDASAALPGFLDGPPSNSI